MSNNLSRFFSLMLLVVLIVFLGFSKEIIREPKPVIDAVVYSENTVFSGLDIKIEILYAYRECDSLKKFGIDDYSETKKLQGFRVYKTEGADNFRQGIGNSEFCEHIKLANIYCKRNRCRFSDIERVSPHDVFTTGSTKFAITSPDLEEVVITNILNPYNLYYQRYKVDIIENNGQLSGLATYSTPFILEEVRMSFFVGIIMIFIIKYLFSLIVVSRQLLTVPLTQLVVSIIYFGLPYLLFFSSLIQIDYTGDMDMLGLFLFYLIFVNLLCAFVESLFVVQLTNSRKMIFVIIFIFSFVVNLMALTIGESIFQFFSAKIISFMI